MLILAVLAAPGHCLAAAGLRVGIGMATRHPGVWRWRVERCDRAQEIHATTCHTGCRQAVTMAFPYCSTSALSASSAVAMAACA